VWGGEFLPISPSEALRTGKFNPVDLLFGLCDNEGGGFTATALSDHATIEDLRKLINSDLLSGHPLNKEADYYIAKLPSNPTVDQLRGMD